jgi:hypothetical protein
MKPEISPDSQYVALHMSGNANYDGTKGFPTHKEAEEHVAKHNCKTCKAFAEKGYAEYQIPGDEKVYREDITPLSTSCAAEWDIITIEEWNSLGDD